MATRIEAGRTLYQKAAWLLDHGRVESHLISMAKWFTGETAVRVADEALQLHGGYGFIGDYNIERFYRDSKIVEIYEGTKEIEKIIIARALLGKYWEKRGKSFKDPRAPIFGVADYGIVDDFQNVVPILKEETKRMK